MYNYYIFPPLYKLFSSLIKLQLKNRSFSLNIKPFLIQEGLMHYACMMDWTESDSGEKYTMMKRS